MSLDGRVGQLFNSKGEPCGTAWLISSKHALTASHCLDGSPLYTIRFTAGNVFVRLVDTPTDLSGALDLAVLTVDDAAGQPDLGALVVPISSRMPDRHDRVNLLGFPFSAEGDVLSGTHLSGEAVSTEAMLKGCPAPVIQLARVPNTTDQMKGVSGGIAWQASPGGKDVAIGVVFYGGKQMGVHVMPMGAAAKWHHAIEEALDQWGDRPPDGLIIQAVEDSGLIDWNGPIPPSAVGKMWKGASPVKSICCRASKSDLGIELNLALLRMVAHGPDVTVQCAVTDWPTVIGSMSLETEVTVTSVPAGRRAKAAGTTFDADALASLIHQALDGYMLERLHEDIVKQCNDVHAQQVRLHLGLRTRMQEIWDDHWYPQLDRDPVLLRIMLLRLSTHAEAEVSPRAVARIGRKLDRWVLWQPILYALALAASGVRLVPAASKLGNFVLPGGEAGHVTGCQQIDRTDLGICLRDTQFWTVWMVILARLEERYSVLLGKSVTMGEGKAHCPGLTDGGLPPMLLTGVSDFKIALKEGADQVCNYLRDEQKALGKVVEERYGKMEADKWLSRFTF